MTSVKELLKSAKSALDSDDADTALTLCRDILKKDRKNYMGYVIAGVAARKKKEPKRAIQAYDMAISINDKLPAAWTGLIEVLEEKQSPTQDELAKLVNAYSTLRDLKSVLSDHMSISRASALSRILDHDVSRRDEAIDAWSTVASTTPDLHVKSRALGEACRAAMLRQIEILSVSELTQNDRFTENLLELRKNQMNIPLDVADYALKHLELLVRTSKSTVKNVVEILLDIIRLVPAYTPCYDLILKLSEEDDGDNLPVADMKRLGQRRMHLAFEPRGISSAFLALSLRDSKLRDYPDSISAVLRSSLRATTELLSVNSSAAALRSATEALMIGCAHLDTGATNLAKATCTHGLKLLKKTPLNPFTTSPFEELDGEISYRTSRITSALRVVLGFCATEERRIETARSNFEAASSHFTIICLRGLAKTAQFSSDEAVESSWDALLRQDSENPEAQLHKAWKGVLAGDGSQEKILLQAADTASARRNRSPPYGREETFFGKKIVGDFAVTEALCCLRAGQAMLARKDEAAKSVLVRAASAAPSLAASFAMLGAFFEKVGDGSPNAQSRAKKCYQRALSADLSHEFAGPRLVSILEQEGLHRDAMKVANTAAENSPLAYWAHLYIGSAKLSRGKSDDAIKSLQLACRGLETVNLESACREYWGADDLVFTKDEFEGAEYKAWLELSRAYQSSGKLSAAASSAKRAIAVSEDPFNRLTATIQLGFILLKLYMLNDSMVAFEEAASVALSMDMQIPAPVLNGRAEAAMNLAQEEWLECRWARAIGLMEVAEKSFRDAGRQTGFAASWKRAADCATLQSAYRLNLYGEKSQAVSEIACRLTCKTVMLRPWEQGYLADLGLALAHAGRCDLALRVLENLLSDNSTQADLWMAAGQVHAMHPEDHAEESLHCFVAAAQLRESAACLMQLGVRYAQRAHTLDEATKCAAGAIRQDPSLPENWTLLGTLREVRAGSSSERLREALHAFTQADALGGGPSAVRGQLRTILRLCDVDDARDTEIFAAWGASLRLGGEKISPLLQERVQNMLSRRQDKHLSVPESRRGYLYPYVTFVRS
eukprot:CAMPEP_0198724774 /NCGR_PEP_ID=MMETSP1475-20131203/2192_1 /TAXON_ID= ORGANISM="Unidentified sp., Strain CCMP1999" /NCGR_SAMPLE_ID=MMETSP1475 /ASSEMBLY_ACC=CAM_ASM_001111 /LENGTH=1065 /DNA_ID=CAMNT_0044486391 /DNA_START=232 /DNA_END=3429 /DNA_ORIENTATION=+